MTEPLVHLIDDGTYNNLQESISFILCADRFQERQSFAEYRDTVQHLTDVAPFVGPAIAAQSLGCDPRIPRSTRRESFGKVRARPDARVLIVGVKGDPATPYDGAVDLRRRIRGSRLLTVEAPRHGGYAQGIACVDLLVNAYLVSMELPEKGSVCRT